MTGSPTLDRGPGGNLNGVGALFELDLFGAYGEEGREGGDAFLVVNCVLVSDGEGVAGVGLVAIDKSILGQAGRNGNRHQVFLLDLQGFSALSFQDSLEGGQRAVLVCIFLEDGLFQTGVVENAD